MKNIHHEKEQKYSRKKYILFMILSVVCVFMLMSVLLISMTLRYYLKEAFPQAVESVVLANVEITQPDGSAVSLEQYLLNNNLSQPLKLLNKLLTANLFKGKNAFLLKALISIWIQPVLLILLMGMLIYMIKMHIRANKRIGTAFRVYSITAVIPGIITFLSGLLITWIVSLLNFPAELEILLRGKTLLFSGISILSCIVLFCFGTIWNRIARKKTPKFSIAVPEKLAEPETSIAVKRQFCRYCGETLINPDAQFCYQCGKKQLIKYPIND